jgi:hypothetical protein
MPLPVPREGVSLGFHVYPGVSDEGTLGNPETIIWSSVRQLCSRSVAEWVAAAKHRISRKEEREAIARNLKLYIQHASEFYEAAQGAKPNTAPLIYYYCFLNLAKALCELRHPQFHERPECYQHGVSWKPNPQKLVEPSTESVSITRRGVWHALWEFLTLSSCTAPNPTRLAIKDLFSYCPEISIEFDRTFGGITGLIAVEDPDVLSSKSPLEAWLRFSIPRVEFRAHGLSAPKMISQLRTARSGYVEVRSTKSELRTFQSATAKRLGSKESALSGLGADILGLNVFTHLGRNSKLGYYFPIQARLPLRMPQLMVSYTILFWLGSLVRYDPHSVSALIDSEYWMLVDGFMSQSRVWLLELFEWAFYQAETTLWIVR